MFKASSQNHDDLKSFKSMVTLNVVRLQYGGFTTKTTPVLLLEPQYVHYFLVSNST